MLIYGVEFKECAHLFIDPRPFRRFHLQEKTLRACLKIELNYIIEVKCCLQDRCVRLKLGKSTI
jgi:hypothetical protein